MNKYCLSMQSASQKRALPYRSARLVIPSKESKDQRWFIKFWCWDAQRKKMVVKKHYQCNSIAPEAERMQFVNSTIKEIDSLLRKGYHINRDTLEKEEMSEKVEVKKEYLLTDAVADLLQRKRNLRQLRTYEQLADKLNRWLSVAGYRYITLADFKAIHLQQYIEWMEDEGNAVRTINNSIAFVSRVYNHVNKMSDTAVYANPANKIERAKNPLGKNLAFRPPQVLQQLQYMYTKKLHIRRLAMMMYYSLARTDELSELRIWMIGFRHPDQIHFPGEICKNGFEKNVVINKELREVLDELELHKFPADWYVFGKDFLPSPTWYNSKYIGSRYRSLVLNKLKYPADYTLYSWKHTGVVNAYFAGVSKASLQLQAGWKNATSFETYLKSLGCFDNPEIKDKFPALPGFNVADV